MAVKNYTKHFVSSTGCDAVYCRIWQDDEVKPVGILQIAHSTFDNIDCYDRFAENMAKNGYIVCGNDHIGHGKTASVLGYTCEKNGHIRMVDDMHRLTVIMKKHFGGSLPYYLLGNSTGSFAARLYCADFGNEIDGAVFCATSDLPDFSLLLETPVDFIADKFGAETPVSFFGKPMTNFLNFPDRSAKWISKDEQEIEQRKENPYCYYNITYSYLRDIAHLVIETSTDSWAARIPKNLPVMLIGGAIDPISANGRNVIGVSDRLGLHSVKHEVILYPDERHDILTCKENERVCADLTEWFNEIKPAK